MVSVIVRYRQRDDEVRHKTAQQSFCREVITDWHRICGLKIFMVIAYDRRSKIHTQPRNQDHLDEVFFLFSGSSAGKEREMVRAATVTRGRRRRSHGASWRLCRRPQTIGRRQP